MRTLTIIAIAIFAAEPVFADDLSPNQQLIDACYRLNQYRVVKLLRDGVSVNTKFGTSPQTLHHGEEWTPLLALVKSPREPASDIAQQQAAKRIAILRVLISHNCELDECDSSGATALHISIHTHDSEFAKLLLVYNPNVNTWATREHWGCESPLHSAWWSPELTAALLSHGANAKVTDEYRLAAAKSYYYRELSDFMKTNGRMPTDDERTLIGYNPKFDDIMTPRERFFERVSAEIETSKTP